MLYMVDGASMFYSIAQRSTVGGYQCNGVILSVLYRGQYLPKPTRHQYIGVSICLYIDGRFWGGIFFREGAQSEMSFNSTLMDKP
jgi:hypothetical protein